MLGTCDPAQFTQKCHLNNEDIEQLDVCFFDVDRGYITTLAYTTKLQCMPRSIFICSENY